MLICQMTLIVCMSEGECLAPKQVKILTSRQRSCNRFFFSQHLCEICRFPVFFSQLWSALFPVCLSIFTLYCVFKNTLILIININFLFDAQLSLLHKQKGPRFNFVYYIIVTHLHNILIETPEIPNQYLVLLGHNNKFHGSLRFFSLYKQ